MEVRIRFDAREVDAALRSLGEAGTRAAMSQAINETTKGLRTDGTRELAAKAQVKKQATVRERFLIEKASRATLSGALVIPATYLPLSAVKGVRVTAKTVRWRGRVQRKMFRIRGKVGALSNDLFVRRSGARSFGRAFAFTLLQEYEKNRVADFLERAGRERLAKAWRRAIAEQIRRRGL